MSKLRHESGFTLVELLVAMGLMSLISLTLVGAFRGIAQVTDRFDKLQNAVEDQRLFVAAVTELLALGYLPPGAASQERVFHAGSDQLVWIGVMPPRHASGGKYVFRIGLETVDSGGSSKLVLRYTPWLGIPPNWESTESKILLVGVQSLRFTYFIGVSPWQVSQSDVSGGPDRVRLSVQLASGVAYPQLVLPFKAMKRASAASFGGGASR
ncbi:MAG TPA: type II secretion system protein [Burkholderiaceae bacterium]|nr:type II secretion system protein [Burkholderiaceae bacterium]